MREKSSGEAFKELRLIGGIKQRELSNIISEKTLRRFEAGETELDLKKLKECLKVVNFSLSSFLYFSGIYMAPHQYGIRFKDLRRQRGYRKDFFAPVGASALEVELFEQGRIMLPYHIIDAMLLIMHVPESDFIFSLNDGHDDYFIQIVDKIDKAYLSGNIEYLKSIESEAREYSQKIEPKEFIPNDDEKYDYTMNRLTRQYTDYRVLELSAKGAYTKLSEAEEIEIGDFLCGIDYWLEYDLGILALDARFLSYDLLHDILSEIRKKIWRYKEKLVYRRRIVQAAGRGALFLGNLGKVEEARELLNLVKEFNVGLDVQIEGMFRFTQAFILYKGSIDKEEQKQGEQDMLKSIDYFNFINEPISYKYCQRVYDNCKIASQ